MPFIETEADYAAKCEKFMRENPGCTEADLAALFPKMNDPKAIWEKFHASAKRNAAGHTNPGAA